MNEEQQERLRRALREVRGCRELLWSFDALDYSNSAIEELFERCKDAEKALSKFMEDAGVSIYG